jgi:hypothetical protein
MREPMTGFPSNHMFQLQCWFLVDKNTMQDNACSTFVNDHHSMWWAG